MAIISYLCGAKLGKKVQFSHSCAPDLKKYLPYLLSVCLLTLLPGALLRAQYDTEVFMQRGRRALADGKYATAIENFNILARLDTSDCYTFFFRGIAKYNLGDLRGARADFDRSVRVNPVFTSGYHYRAITESRTGEYEEALADLDKALSLRPGFSGLYYSRGVTYFLSRQFEKAVADFDWYIKREPRDPSAYLNRGAAKLFLKDTVQSLADYNKAIRLDRFEPEGYMRRGRLYAELGDFGKAVEDITRSIELDPKNTYAYFNRALMYYELKRYNDAMDDFNRVLADEPGNSLTLYNRALVYTQVGRYDQALEDLDRVLDINPNNVLAHFNRAAVFIEMQRWRDALEDYDASIRLYPDFAKAYMNRSYVKNRLGDKKGSKKDYDTAREKVRQYSEKNVTDQKSLADTTRKYSSLLSLEADFAKKDFDDELLQHRDVDIQLRPLYRFTITREVDRTNYALSRKYEHPAISRFVASQPVPVELAVKDAPADLVRDLPESSDFIRSMSECSQKHYNLALSYIDKSVEGERTYNKAFHLMNRAVLRAEVIDFISSIEDNVQVLSMDDSGQTRARVRDKVTRQYDYSEAIRDLQEASRMIDNIPYIYFNLGNLHCLNGEHIKAIDDYGKALALYPYMSDAYFNRGLVLIYLKDREKGCIDLSRAGELGVADAYGVIKKYCEEGK